MKLIQFITFLLLFVQNQNLLGQNCTIINYGDSVFMERIFYLDGSSSPFWDLKPNLAEGDYLVVKNSLCGIDTLIKAYYSENGVKDGTWTKWEIRECFLEQDINTDEVIGKFWSDTKSKWEEVYYKESFLIRQKIYHSGSDIIHSETTYGKNATQTNEWKNQKLFSTKGKIQLEINYNEIGQSEYKEFFKNGNISSQGKYGLFSEVIEDWFYFYEDGTLKAKGAYEEHTQSLGRPTLELIENGKWEYYNKNGYLVAEVDFNFGEILSFKKYLNEEIPMPKIEELVNKE